MIFQTFEDKNNDKIIIFNSTKDSCFEFIYSLLTLKVNLNHKISYRIDSTFFDIFLQITNLLTREYQLNRMFVVNWVKDKFMSTLQALGLLNKKGTIVFVGLDNAGKTTLLYRLKTDTVRQIDPTEKPHSEELVLGKIRFTVRDLGGHVAVRKTWRNYVTDVDGIVYMVDAADPKRFEQSRIELEGLLQIPEIEHIPIVIFGNKIDKKGAVSEMELRQALGLPDRNIENMKSKPQGRQIQLFMCSIARKIGFGEGFKWLSSFIK